MANFKGVPLTRQPVATRQYNPRDVLYIIQAFNGNSVRTYRTENPARALTVCKPYARDSRMIQITVWLRVGVDTMIPMSYTACSDRDLADAFQSITRDIACAFESTQIDEKREEQKELASQEIPSFTSFPEFMCESGEALER